MNRAPRHPALAEEVRGRVPEGPGVYFFRGDRDEILYIGKALNLRQRMLSHLRAGLQADEPRHVRLLYEVRSFDFHATASELLALLQEDELIKKHQPRYNVRQNEYLEYRYLELTADEHPRLRMCEHVEDFTGRRVFGPYRDRYMVDDILQLIHKHLGLRSCTDLLPTGGCIEFDLGHCAGPCRAGAASGDYRHVVARAVDFLEGDVSEVAGGLQRAMARASERLEFEKAQELKDRLAFCRRFGDRQRFLTGFRERKLIVVEKSDPERGYVFLRGRLIAHGTAGGAAAGAMREPATRVLREPAACVIREPASVPSDPPDDPRFALDRASVVHGWLRRNSSRCEHRFTDL